MSRQDGLFPEDHPSVLAFPGLRDRWGRRKQRGRPAAVSMADPVEIPGLPGWAERQ